MTDEDTGYIDPNDRIPEHDPELALADKISELQEQENAVINVYRQLSGNNAKMPFLFTVPVDKYSIPELQQYIRDNYGGGDFRIHIRDGSKVVANKLLSIEAPKDNAPPQQAQTNDLAPVVERMMQRMERMEERLSNPAPQQPQQDPMDMMAKMMGLMTQMQQAMPQPAAQSGRQKSLVEELQEAKQVYEMFGEMGAGKDDGGFAQLMRDGLQPMIQMMQEEAKAKREGRQPNPQAKQPPQNAGQQQGNPSGEANAMMSNVRTLLAAAERNGDPETYSEIVLDFVPEERYVEVYDFLKDESCIDVIAERFPQVNNHREWFQSLRSCILSALDAGEDADDTSGHVDHAADDARPGDIDGSAAGEGGDAKDAAGHVEDGEGGEVEPSDATAGHADRVGSAQ